MVLITYLGMKYPAAFMSSKPDAGINHKVYGVTSEGVAVFLQVALQKSGIDPFTQPFTVKITGVPNGDVAGNMIRILRRDYPNTAKIVGKVLSPICFCCFFCNYRTRQLNFPPPSKNFGDITDGALFHRSPPYMMTKIHKKQNFVILSRMYLP